MKKTYLGRASGAVMGITKLRFSGAFEVGGPSAKPRGGRPLQMTDLALYSAAFALANIDLILH